MAWTDWEDFLSSVQPACHISLVSHEHGELVLQALHALAASLPRIGVFKLWLTFNVPEPDLQAQMLAKGWPFEVAVIENPHPLGFGANHNQAFARSGLDHESCDWFLVMNPDIFWPPHAHGFWQGLYKEWPRDVGVVCPAQVDADGQRQDFARCLITPWGLAMRALRKLLRLPLSGVADAVEKADWVNGACMIWRAQAFAEAGGFDERYFMYCEDTDICLRAQTLGWRLSEANVTVVHDARRHTGRSWRHLRWHVASMCRLWTSRAFWVYLMQARRRPA